MKKIESKEDVIGVNIPYPYEFLPKQKQVFDAIFRNNKKFILYSGAFGAGKTFLIQNVVTWMCIRYPGSIWLDLAQTFPNLRDTVVRTFIEVVEDYQLAFNEAKLKLPVHQQKYLDIKLEKDFKISTMSFKFFNDSEVLFRSCDDATKFKSLNLEGFAIDEPVDIAEDIFLMLQGRLRGKHSPFRLGIMAGNPSAKTNWVYQRFFVNPGRDYFAVHTTTYDNKFLPEDYIPMMEKSYDEDYKRRYLYGEWGSFEGQVFKDFHPDKHVGNYKSKECKYHIAGFDDGTRNPCCLLVIGIDDDNNIFVKDEFYESGLVDSEKAQKIYEYNLKYGFHKIFIDPSALSMHEALKNMRLHVLNANNDIFLGVGKLKSFFANDIIHIDKGCKNLCRELENYRYEKTTNTVSKNVTEVPVKKDDHSCDSFRYGITDFNPFREHVPLMGGRW